MSRPPRPGLLRVVPMVTLAVLGIGVATACADTHAVDDPVTDAPNTAGAPSTTPTRATQPTAQRTRRLEQLGEVACWAPVFGGVAPDLLDGYDLVVVDGTLDRNGDVDTGPDTVAQLQASGALVVAYLSVGTVEDWRAHTSGLPPQVALDPVDGWPGERYADAREPAWRAVLLDVVTLLDRAGFDGLYLDNLDVAELYPTTRSAVIDLVDGLRRRAPELLLIGQNGLSVADELPIDAIAHEDVFWRWDGGYRRTDPAETARTLTGLRRLQDRGLPVLTLDYTEPGSAGGQEAVRASQAEGFVPAVSVLGLDRPPHDGGCTVSVEGSPRVHADR